jgi:hypothetical protein
VEAAEEVVEAEEVVAEAVVLAWLHQHSWRRHRHRYTR